MPQLPAGKLPGCWSEQVALAQARGILRGPHEAEEYLDPHGRRGPVLRLGGRYYRGDAELGEETWEEVPAQWLQWWELDLTAFLEAIAAANEWSGQVRRLGREELGVWQVGRGPRLAQGESQVVFVAAGVGELLDLRLQEVQTSLGKEPLLALLAEPHPLSGATVARLSDQGVQLVLLPTALQEDLRVLPPGGERPPLEVELIIEVSAHQVQWRGITVPLTPVPFRLLLHLARRPRRDLHWNQLPEEIARECVGNPRDALADQVRRLRRALAAAAEQAGEDPNEARALIKTRPCIGYRLDLPTERVAILP